MRHKSTPEGFWARVAQDGDCLIWSAARNRKGYGIIRWRSHSHLAHRIAYVLTNGPIPEGQELDHLCRKHACVNPDHLEAVPHRTNVLRGEGWAGTKARQTQCKRGHEFTPENTLLVGTYGRRCKTCTVAYRHSKYLQKKALAAL